MVDGDALQEHVVESDGERLDRWLAVQVGHLSRSRVQKLIETGHVWCNGRLCTDKKRLLSMGDRVELEEPEPVAIDLVPEVIPLDILYEDTQLLIVNKPKGMVVHPSAGHERGTLVHALLAHCGQLSQINGEYRPGIVHRLDKDTSGVIAIAKTDAAHHSLQAQIQAKTARRLYLGLVYGRPQAESGVIETYIGRHPQDRKKMAVVPDGRWAITHWRVRQYFENLTLIEFDLETGRTHQIRVHAAHIGHPIVGDLLYCNSRKPLLHGQALHAWQLHLSHPTNNTAICVTAPLEPTMLTLMRRLDPQWSL